MAKPGLSRGLADIEREHSRQRSQVQEQAQEPSARRRKTTAGKRRLCTAITPEMYRRLRRYAVDREIEINEVVEEALGQFLPGGEDDDQER